MQMFHGILHISINVKTAAQQDKIFYTKYIMLKFNYITILILF
jgi:hypothetical protein